ncbi:TPR-like protein [Phlegmacium glaucopus]|nr:TPR-like protein [Phlegmacium glaucopus]
MALPMLVGGGAECGPSNPLQGLSKRSDQDRGLQQDHFGAGRVGSSRELFRSQQGIVQDQDAARFFSATSSRHHFPLESAYDLSAMHAALPVNQTPQTHSNPLALWATDFVQQQPLHAFPSQELVVDPISATDIQVHAPSQYSSPGSQQWNPTMSRFQMNPMPGFIPHMPIHQIKQHESGVHDMRISWDKEFNAQESHLASSSPLLVEEPAQKELPQQPVHDGDGLARTAALLLENIKHERNPKFQNSQFLGLMKQLRDGQVIVEGNQMVESDGRTSSKVDFKGKGRAIDLSPSSTFNSQDSGHGPQSSFLLPEQQQGEQGNAEEDVNDSYFRQENADFIRYWNDIDTQVNRTQNSTAETLSWDKLQVDWDNFEATSSGIKAITHYRFQQNNPYLLGDPAVTRQHLVHAYGRQSALENVLELEAAVQRNVEDATTWFELGVKQQENEREHKALQALQRAVELEPSHLPAWLALSISYTNDSNRQGTYDAINEWVKWNTKYQDTVQQFFAQNVKDGPLPLAERYSQLIQCLITMARSNTSGAIDADIQIALAVLLNTNEEYEKAQDCFKAALAVRPDDWLLYNRVGATMANSSRAEEALGYYFRALELNPGYIRARFNLGISCMNLRRYDEAAQHILDALVLQDNDGVRENTTPNEKRGIIPSTLWDSLRTTCLHIARPDLVALCDIKDLEGFRNHFP